VTNHVARLGNQIRIPIEADEAGYIGRECPIKECLGYFKITPGTGITTPAPCNCPYCGHIGESSTFFTPEQIEYARSVALRQVTDAIHRDLKPMEFDHRPRGPFGIGISLKVTQSTREPIRYYREKELETEVVCDKCTLRYAIYGVFGWCPDCGVHNSFQILLKNLELARKELSLAESVEKESAERLIGDALENVVSAFDGYGRQICEEKGAEIRFQNPPGARRLVREAFGFDFADGIANADWENLCRVFQKRHLLSHKMAVIDGDYVKNPNDPTAVVGRKIKVSRGEVIAAIGLIEELGRRLFSGLFPPSP